METPDTGRNRRFNGRIAITGLIITLASFLSFKEDPSFTPGKERWPIKTSVTHFTPVKHAALREIMDLTNPVKEVRGQLRKEYQDKRFPGLVGKKNFREGDIISTTGYILLAAIEKDKNGEDGDIHVQVRISSNWADSCLIVEATYPPFIKGNQRLQDSCKKVRDFFEEMILCGKNIIGFGTHGKKAPLVQITGQLFFDAHHMNSVPRGKSNPKTKEKMHSYSCWELHPVISISEIRK